MKMEVQTKHRNNNREKNVHQKNGFVYNTSKDSSQGIKCCECGTSNGLHQFNCLPSHLQFNRFVHTGYRLNMSTWQCFKSLFYFHNESFNVYSHGLLGIFFILCAPYVYGKLTSSQHVLLYSIHYITSIACPLCSAIFHLMMCHKEGEEMYCKLNTLDWLGIWFVTTWGPIAFIKGTFFCSPWLYKIVLLFYSSISSISLVYLVRGKNAEERIVPVICVGLVKVGIYASRGYMAWTGYPTAKVEAVWFFVVMELIGLLGAVFHISQYPERWVSGKFDYLWNSHNILHILSSICPILLHLGTVIDVEWMETAKC